MREFERKLEGKGEKQRNMSVECSGEFWILEIPERGGRLIYKSGPEFDVILLVCHRV